ncbi:hypothetical protein H7J92_03220 [Sporosarcina aquimarina]|nr:hypothetical protein [Sporosarcina aquimarina]
MKESKKLGPRDSRHAPPFSKR